MKAANEGGDDGHESQIPQNLFLFSEESNNGNQHIKFVEERNEPPQLNVAQTAAKLNNSKNIGHNFYSRAQDTLNKRNKQARHTTFSTTFADAVKSVKTTKSFADQLDFPFDLSTAIAKPLTPRTPPSNKKNSPTSPNNGNTFSSPPNSPRRYSLDNGETYIVDHAEYQSFLRDNKGALKHLMRDINGSMSEHEHHDSYYDRDNSPTDLGNGLSMPRGIGVEINRSIASKEGSHSNTSSLVNNNSKDNVAAKVNPVLDVPLRVSFDISEPGDHSPTITTSKVRSLSDGDTLRPVKTVSFGPSAATNNNAGDITKIEITRRERPSAPSPHTIPVDNAEQPQSDTGVGEMRTASPTPVIIVTPRLTVVPSDIANNGWGGVSLIATPTVSLSPSEASPYRDGNNHNNNKHPQWNETSILSLGSFQGPQVMGGGFRPRSAPTHRTASSLNNHNNGNSSSNAVDRPTSSSNKPNYLLQTNPSTNMANILLSKVVEPVKPSIFPMEINTMNNNMNKHAHSQGDLRVLLVPPPTTTRPSSSNASPRLQSAVTFRNHQVTELLIAKKLTTTVTASGNAAAVSNVVKLDKSLQKSANQQELSRFVFTPSESPNMLTNKAVHDEIVQQQIRSLTTPNKHVTISVVSGSETKQSNKQQLQQTRPQLQRPHTADGLMRSRGVNSSNNNTSSTLPAIQTADTSSAGGKSEPSSSSSNIFISPETTNTIKSQLSRFKNIVEPEAATPERIARYQEKQQQALANAVVEVTVIDDKQPDQPINWKAFVTPTKNPLKKPSTAPSSSIIKSSVEPSSHLSPVPHNMSHYAATTPLMLYTNDLLSQPTIDDSDYFQTSAFNLDPATTTTSTGKSFAKFSPRNRSADDHHHNLAANPLLESPYEAPNFQAPDVAPPAQSPLQMAKRHKQYSSYVRSMLYDEQILHDIHTPLSPTSPGSSERQNAQDTKQAASGVDMATVLSNLLSERPTTTNGSGANYSSSVPLDTSGNASYVKLNSHVKSPRISELAQIVNNIHSTGSPTRPATSGAAVSALWNSGSFDASGYYRDVANTSELLAMLQLGPETNIRPSTSAGVNNSNNNNNNSAAQLNLATTPCALSPRSAPQSKAIVKAYNDKLTKKMSKEKEIRVARLRAKEQKKLEDERLRVLAMNAKVKAALAEAKSRSGHRHGVPTSPLKEDTKHGAAVAASGVHPAGVATASPRVSLAAKLEDITVPPVTTTATKEGEKQEFVGVQPSEE